MLGEGSGANETINPATPLAVKPQLDEIPREADAMREYISGSRDHQRRCSSVFGAIGAAAAGMTMTTGKSFDYEQALGDPCRIFGEPGNVLSHPALDAKQKREILESWWQDAVRLSESEGENMGGGNEPMLKRVNDALLELERQTGVGAAHKRTIT